MRRTFRAAILLLALAAAAAAHSKVAKDLQSKFDSALIDEEHTVVVQFNAVPGTTEQKSLGGAFKGMLNSTTGLMRMKASEIARLDGGSSIKSAAALPLQQNPSMTPNQVKSRLMKTASKAFPRNTVSVVGGAAYATCYHAFTVGAGYLNIMAPLSSQDLLSASASLALSPRALRNGSRVSLSVPVSSLVWGDSSPKADN